MASSFKRILDIAFHNRPLEDVLAASPAALRGVSSGDAQKLLEAFGIRTIQELAESRHFEYARTLLAAAGTPGYDAGPPRSWEKLLARAPLAYYRDHPSGRFRAEFGPVFYRGRLDGTARVLVVGQDPATDELIAQRAFVGRSGQRIQGLLKKIGITRSYVMVNAFLFGMRGQFDPQMQGISLETEIRSYREKILDRLAAENDLELVISVGNGADHALNNWPVPVGLTVVEITHPSADATYTLPNWNAHVAQLIAAVGADPGQPVDNTPYGGTFTAADEVSIPRFDLPFGIADFHGTGGTRSARDGDDEIVWKAS